MGENLTIANLLAQIAIIGRPNGEGFKASEEEIVRTLRELGIPEAQIQEVVEKALELDVIDRTDKDLALAS
jgi:BioD-like phosphotransacetylase family protein